MSRCGFRLCLLALTLLVCGGIEASAQTGGAPAVVGGDAKKPVVVRKINGLARRGYVKTPQITSNLGTAARPPRDWARITVEYDTEPEWMDEVVVAFHVMTLQREGSKNAYSLFRKEVRYVDIARGRLHEAEVYLRPAALERFGEVVAVAAVFSVQGEAMGSVEERSRGGQLPKDWFENPAVTEKKDLVTPREGYLLNRMETPFAHVHFDDYEAIR